MLPSSQRLRTKEVAEVLRRGKGLPSGEYLSAKTLLISGDATIRTATVISKKVAKTAVVRNRVRRAVYDAIGVVGDKLQATSKTSAYIVIFVRALPSGDMHLAFTNDLQHMFSKLAARS